MNAKDFLSSKLCPCELENSNLKAKKSIFYAFVLTFSAMIVEIIAGSVFGSMALLADGWHMSSHALALGLALLGYMLANHYAKDARFNFGSYKLEVLTAYTSALFLLGVAFFMAYHSIERLINPQDIAYKEAIVVAFLGLFVNAFCVWLLRDEESAHSHSHGHSHSHSHSHAHSHDHEHLSKHSHEHDHENSHSHTHLSEHLQATSSKSTQGKSHSKDINLKAAYLHVLADALTSILAIIALFGGLFFAWWWLDSLMGLLGATLVFIWAVGLIKQSSKILLDITMDEPILSEVLALCKDFGEIRDLHLLRISKEKYACILSLKSKESISFIKERLSHCKALAHIFVELL